MFSKLVSNSLLRIKIVPVGIRRKFNHQILLHIRRNVYDNQPLMTLVLKYVTGQYNFDECTKTRYVAALQQNEETSTHRCTAKIRRKYQLRTKGIKVHDCFQDYPLWWD